jgi:hypothetical protein
MKAHENTIPANLCFYHPGLRGVRASDAGESENDDE